MGRTPTIDTETGAKLLEAYQRTGSQCAAARAVGVSETTARRYLEATPAAAAPVVATQRAMLETTGAALFDTRAALEENYQRLLTLVATAQAAESAQEIQAYTGVLREIRSHIETSMDMARLLIDVEQIRAFQQAVLDAIGEADDATRQRIIDTLRQRRAVDIAL